MEFEFVNSVRFRSVKFSWEGWRRVWEVVGSVGTGLVVKGLIW